MGCMTAPIPRDIPDLPALPNFPGVTPPLLPSPAPARAVVPPVRRPIAAAYRLFLALAATAAVTGAVLLAGPARALSHFTVQSTILLALVTLASARRAWTARHPLPGALTGAALLYVTMASLVHHVLLSDAPARFSLTGEASSGPAVLTAHALHTVIPVAALLDWLLLSPPARTHLHQAAPWLLYPLVYLLFSLARGELLPDSPDRFLYPFLDAAHHGYRSVLADCLLLGLSFYAAAVLLVTADHIRPKAVLRR